MQASMPERKKSDADKKSRAFLSPLGIESRKEIVVEIRVTIDQSASRQARASAIAA